MDAEVAPPQKHVRSAVARMAKGAAKGADVSLCSVCGATKRNRAAVDCNVCGLLCFGCDLAKHPGEPSAADEGTGAVEHDPAMYLLIHAVAKKTNAFTVIRSCVAMGVREVVVAGSNKFNSFGCQGSEAYMTFKYFPQLEEAVAYLKNDRGCEVVGVEICDDAEPLATAPFKGPTAFLMGNEGDGLTEKEMGMCDWFTYIPHHGSGTASLNVAIAASIVLYAFATWAKYAEAPRTGYKYDVAPRPQRQRGKKSLPSASPAEIRQARELKRQKAAAAAATGDGGGVGGGGGAGGAEGGGGGSGGGAGGAGGGEGGGAGGGAARAGGAT